MAEDQSVASLLRNGRFLSNEDSLLERANLARKVFGDPRKNINQECGYPDSLTPKEYRRLFDEDGIARRCVCILPQECFASSPDVYEVYDEEDTPFEAGVKELVARLNLWFHLEKLDELSGISEMGGLLLGWGDGKSLSEPVAGIDLQTGKKKGQAKNELLFLQAFDQSCLEIDKLEENMSSPRYGQPVSYKAQFINAGAGGLQKAPFGKQQEVHWTRILHNADNTTTNKILGSSRIEPVRPRIYDIQKILGANGEGYWKGGFPGLALETYPNIESPELDETRTKAAMYAYMNGLQRYLALTGTRVRSLSTQVADPNPHFMTQIIAICIALGVPARIFMGSEEAKLASTQDLRSWFKRIARRQNTYLTPNLIIPFFERVVAAGVIPEPKGPIIVDWPDLHQMSDQDRADTAAKLTVALQQYETGGVERMISPFDYWTVVWGMEPSKARMMVKNAEENRAKKEKAGLLPPVQVPGENPAGTKGAMNSPFSGRND